MAFPSFFFFVFASVISAWWLSLMLAATASGVEEGGDCSPKKCGDLTISPPFWINRRPQKSKACGFRDFLVDCNDSTGVATLPSTTKYGFDIFNISYGERTMLVLDFHKVVDLTDSTNCHIPIRNTSAKLGILFKISPANRNLVFYNCTAKPLAAAERRELGLVETRCRNNSFARLGGPYDSQSNLDEYSLEGCSTTFLPVLLKPGGPANATGYLDLMRGGFLTTWELPSETSGNVKGLQSTRGDGRACGARPSVVYLGGRGKGHLVGRGATPSAKLRSLRRPKPTCFTQRRLLSRSKSRSLRSRRRPLRVSDDWRASVPRPQSCWTQISRCSANRCLTLGPLAVLQASGLTSP